MSILCMCFGDLASVPEKGNNFLSQPVLFLESKWSESQVTIKCYTAKLNKEKICVKTRRVSDSPTLVYCLVMLWCEWVNMNSIVWKISVSRTYKLCIFPFITLFSWFLKSACRYVRRHAYDIKVQQRRQDKRKIIVTKKQKTFMAKVSLESLVSWREYNQKILKIRVRTLRHTL